MILRNSLSNLKEALQNFPVVGLLGPRQIGKTTLVKELAKLYNKAVYLDLEKVSDQNKLSNAELFFELNRENLIIIDEIQRKPEIFPSIRAEVDEFRVAGRFLILGSASPTIIRTSAESLAGRVKYFELDCLKIFEDQTLDFFKLWLFGGFPEAYLKKNMQQNRDWYDAFIETYLYRDLPALGLNTTSIDLSRLVIMLAHLTGHNENDSQLAASLGVKSPTVKKALDFFEEAFLLRRLPAWHTNIKKRLIKSPKLYLRDTGLVHALLKINSNEDLLGNPVVGFSFELLVIEHLISFLKPYGYQFYYYKTQDGTEADLVAIYGNVVKYCFEIKLSHAPQITKSIKLAFEDLKPQKYFIINPGADVYPIAAQFEVVGIEKIFEILGENLISAN